MFTMRMTENVNITWTCFLVQADFLIGMLSYVFYIWLLACTECTKQT